MLRSIQARLNREKFQPTALAILVHPAYLIRRDLFQVVRKLAPEIKGKVMDLGCGSKPYENLFEQAQKYVGVDIEVSGHDHKNSKVDVYYDGRHLPFEDGAFDAVVSFEVFEHIFNPTEVLAEVRRVMRPQGTLLISTPFAWDEHEAPYDYARYSSFGIRHLLETNGFEVVSITKSNNYVRAVAQMAIAYLFQCVLPRKGVARWVAQLLVICPLTVLALLLDKLLPASDQYYSNCVTLARRKA